MSTHAAAGRIGTAAGRRGAVEAAVAVWSVVVIAGTVGAVSVPHLRMLSLAMPLALVGIGVLTRVEPTPGELRATLWAVVLAGGSVAGWVILTNTEWAIAVPAIAAMAVVTARWPAASTIGLFAVAGFYQSILALTVVQPYKVADVLIAGLVVGVLWNLVVRRKDAGGIILWPGVALVLAYALITAFQVPLADSVKIGRDSFHASTWYLLAFLAIVVAPWRRATYDRIVRGVIAASALVGAYAVFRWIAGPASAERDAVLATRAAFNFVDGKLVLFGSFPTGHHLAAWAGVIVPFCFAYALVAREAVWRVLALVACGLCTAALVGSKVRAGFVGLAIGLAVVLITVIFSRGFAPIRMRAVVAGAIALVTVVVTFAALASGPEGTRYANILNPSADQPFKERTYKWHDALNDIDHHPWGQGLGTAGITQVDFGRFISVGKTDVDNSYLKIALDQGIGVTLLYIAALLALLGGLIRRALASTDAESAAVAAGAAGALVSFIVVIGTGVYIEGLTALAAWLVFALGVARFSHRSG